MKAARSINMTHLFFDRLKSNSSGIKQSVIKYLVSSFSFLIVIMSVSGCTHTEIRAKLECGANPDSYHCASLKSQVKKHNDDAPEREVLYACAGKSESRGCKQAIELEKISPKYDITKSENILATRSQQYVRFVAQSQNKEWIVLEDKSKNFFEIKNVITGEKKYWHGDDHEISHIMAISNDGGLAAYLYGAIDSKNVDGGYAVILFNTVSNEILSKTRFKTRPVVVKFSPKSSYISVYLKTNGEKFETEVILYSLRQGLNRPEMIKKIALGDEVHKSSSFGFSSNEKRFFTLGRNTGLNVYDLQDGFPIIPNRVVLKPQVRGGREIKIAGATFREKADRLVVLLETEISTDEKQNFLLRSRRNLSLAVEQMNGSFVESNIGSFPYDGWPDRFGVISNKSGSQMLVTHGEDFDFHFAHLSNGGQVEKLTECCTNAKTSVETAIHYKRHKFLAVNIDGVYFDSDISFVVYPSDSESLFYPIRISEGKWKRVAEW